MTGSQVIAISYGLSIVFCVLMIIAFTRGFKTNSTTLPSFAAVTTLASFGFCLLCLFVSLVAKYQQSDGQVVFATLLLAPLGLAFCSLISGFVFLVVRATPKLSRVVLSDADRRTKSRTISVVALCMGLVLACTVFVVG